MQATMPSAKVLMRKNLRSPSYSDMRVLIFEDNLMWSSRLVKSVSALGHEAVLRTKAPDEAGAGDVAIVNLGSATLDPTIIVPKLHEQGVKVIAHAGHKEKELHEVGKGLGCERLVTNSELTYKLEQILTSFL